MIALNIRVPGIPRKYQKSTLGYSWEIENLENRHPPIDGNGKNFSVLLIDLAMIASPGHDRYCDAFKFRIYNAKVNVTLKNSSSTELLPSAPPSHNNDCINELVYCITLQLWRGNSDRDHAAGTQSAAALSTSSPAEGWLA